MTIGCSSFFPHKKWYRRPLYNSYVWVQHNLRCLHLHVNGHLRFQSSMSCESNVKDVEELRFYFFFLHNDIRSCASSNVLLFCPQVFRETKTWLSNTTYWEHMCKLERRNTRFESSLHRKADFAAVACVGPDIHT